MLEKTQCKKVQENVKETQKKAECGEKVEKSKPFVYQPIKEFWAPDPPILTSQQKNIFKKCEETHAPHIAQLAIKMKGRQIAMSQKTLQDARDLDRQHDTWK